MKKTFLLLISALLVLGSACKSKPAGEDPYKKIDEAHKEHRKQNPDHYK